MNGTVNITGSSNTKNISTTGTISATGKISSNDAITSATDLKAKRFVINAVEAISTSGATLTIDLSNSNIFSIIMSHNVSTLTLNNPAIGNYILKLTHTGNAHTITWPSSIKWNGDTTLSTTGAKIDIVTLIYDGNNYYGSIAKGY